MKRVSYLVLRSFTAILILVSLAAVSVPAHGATLTTLQGATNQTPVQPTVSPLQKNTLSGTAPRLPGATVNDGQIMKVMSPTGQGMYLGTTVRIQWEWPGYVNFPADVTLGEENSQPGVFRPLAPIDTNRTALWTAWAIPYTFTPGFYTIRVASSKNPNNHADYRIKVMNSTISVTSPNSNFTMATGSTYSIWWTYQGKPGPVKIELSNTSGSAPLIISANTPGGELGSGRYDWTVPSTLATASNYLVRITSLASSSIIGMSQPFSIAPPSITITSPRTGDEFLPAVYIPITWRSVGNNFGATAHITAWAAGSEGTSLDLQCPLSQGIYSQWMPIPLDRKQSYIIRVESTQNRSIGMETGPVTILPKQSQAPNTDNTKGLPGTGK